MIYKALGLKVLILPLSLVVVAVISIFFIQPEFKKMRENKMAVGQDKAKLNELRQQASKLSELKKNFESLEEAKIVNAALPESEATEDYLAELQQRANRSGISISAFAVSKEVASLPASICPEGQTSANSSEPAGGADSSPSPVAPSTTAGAEPVGSAVQDSCAKSTGYDISAKGSWDQLVSFFKYLSDSNRIVNVKKVDLKSAGENNLEGQPPSDLISANILLEAYSKPKESTSDAKSLGVLAGGSGFNKEIIKRVREAIYLPYEPPIVSETTERNFFK